MKKTTLNTIIGELKNASKMHLRQSEELQDHAKEMAGAVSAPDAENTTTQEQMMNLMPAKRQFMGGVSP